MKGVALVTGAGRGLGRILATFLAGQGHDLVITSRTPTELHDVARSLESTGVKVAPIPGDITDPTHRTHLLQQTNAIGGLSLLVNNASDLGEIPRPELASKTRAAELKPRHISVVSVDPGDMRTRMHQDAFPDEDISDRPLPEVTLPFWAWLVSQDLERITGMRYQAQGTLWEIPA